jgi:hypothetical protein
MNHSFSAKPNWLTSRPHSIFKAILLGLAVVVASLWFSHSACAIDPLRLHRKPFLKPPFANQPTRLPSASERAIRESESILDLFEFGPTWFPLGPSPIPNGQTIPVFYTLPANSPEEKPVSGRVSAIAVDPIDPNIVYAGPAQGGVFRSIDGGQTWSSLFAGAKNFAIGSITIDPKDHDKVIVGTGEGNFSGDSHFGVGIYVIEEATSWFPHLKGPYGLDPNSKNVLAKRAITQVLVDPKEHSVLHNLICFRGARCSNGRVAPGPWSLSFKRFPQRPPNF